MNVIIVEDDPVAVQRLRNMLREMDQTIEVIEVMDSVEAGIHYFRSGSAADIIFMDVELRDGKSFDIFKEVDIAAPVIFITAHEDHAIKAFKQNSIDYLLKPLNRSDLQAALLKHKKIFAAAMELPVEPGEENFRSIPSLPAKKKRFLTRLGTKLTSVPAENIAYFYTKDRQQFIKTKSCEDLMYDKRLEEVEAELDPQRFFRVNRQFIISYDSIEKVHAWFGGKLKLQVAPGSYEDIIISRLRAAEFRRWLGE